MTRGNLVAIVSKDEIYMSPQYNGDMYPDGNGVKAYIALDAVETKEDFEEAVKDFQNSTFPGYGDFTIFRIPDLDFGNEYYRRFNSDYLYIKNISGKDFTITAKDSGEMKVIRPGEIQTWDFGKLVEPDFESMPTVKTFRRNQTKESVNDSQKAPFLDCGDINIFRIPDLDSMSRDKMFRGKQTNESVEADTTGMTLDELIDVCRKKTDYEYEKYLEDLLNKPAFAVLEQAERYIAMKKAHDTFVAFLFTERRAPRKIYELICEANSPVSNLAADYLLHKDKEREAKEIVECLFNSLLENRKNQE